jgi:hypothetical protein
MELLLCGLFPLGRAISEGMGPVTVFFLTATSLWAMAVLIQALPARVSLQPDGTRQTR